MEPSHATDSIVLIAGPTPAVLSALMVVAVAVVGALVGVLMARRGRVEAWSLVGVFGLVIFGALVVLAYAPTRLVLDKSGAALAFWTLQDERTWKEIESVSIRRGRFGFWVTFRMQSDDGRLFWTRWPGFFIADVAAEPRQIAMRIDAWRLSGNR